MNKDKIVGLALIFTGIIITVLYSFLLFVAEERIQFIVVKYTIYVSIIMISGILIYLGFALLTIPPPVHPEELRNILKDLNNMRNNEDILNNKKKEEQ